MTEKRFTISGVGISDHEKKRLYDLQTIDGFISVRDELNALHEENEQLKQQVENITDVNVRCCNEYSYFHKRMIELEKENKQLKSTIAQLIEQNRKNNDLLLSDIRILEKALWCGGCENDYGRLKELRREFIR